METSTTNHREPIAFGRLLVRSALLGTLIPVGTQGEYWNLKLNQVITALVLCLVLYAAEKAVLWPFRKRLNVKPHHLAACRGAALIILMSVTWPSGNIAKVLGEIAGSGLVGGFVALALFKLEDRIIKSLTKKNSPRRAE